MFIDQPLDHLSGHRKHGPAFLAAFGRSVKHPEYTIPAEINRVSLQNLLMSMASILEEHGSDKLREDIRYYAADIVSASRQCATAEQFLTAIENLSKKITFDSPILAG